MSSQKKTFFLFFALLVVVGAITTTALRSQGQNDSLRNERRAKPDESQWPIVDYAAPSSADPEKQAKRQARSKKHDKSDLKVDASDIAEASALGGYADFALPAFPISHSSIVVIGEVTSAQAYLSNDLTGVYSEFTIHIEEVLKNNSADPLSNGSLIEAERKGGRVRFQSGRVQRYSIDGERMPQIGRRYVFFLAGVNREQGFHILTGYELRAGKVNPLDYLPKLQLYKDADETAFLNALRGTIGSSSQPSN